MPIMFDDLEDEADTPEEVKVEPTGEVNQYYPINFNPSTWGNIPKELMIQTALALEPNRQDQAGIVNRLGPEGYQTQYDPQTDSATVTDPSTGMTGYINEPGFSPQDAFQTAVLAGAFTPAGRVGRAATTPAQLAARTGTAAALTEGGRQAVSNLAGANSRDENMIPGSNMFDVGMAGVTQMVPDFLTSTSFMGKYGPASWQNQNYFRRMQENLADLETSGLQALRGQVSEVPEEARDLKVLGNLRHSGPEITEEFRSQNTGALSRTDEILEGGALAGDKPSGPAARRAALEERQRLVDARKDATGPLYRGVFSDVTPYSTDQLVEGIDETLSTVAPGTRLHSKLNGVRKMLGGKKDMVDELTGDVIPVPADPRTLEQMQSVKEELDDAIQSAVTGGKGKLASRLLQTKEDTVAYIQKNSDEYKEARETYAELSKPINEFDDSILGQMAKSTPEEAYRLGDIIFNPRVSTAARNDIRNKLDATGEGVFRNLALETMRGRLGEIRDIGLAEVPNVPYQIMSKIFKNEKEREMWKAALPDKAEELDALFRGLKIQARNRSIGSDTAFNQEAVGRLSGSGVNSATDLAKQLMEWLTVAPAVTRYTLGGINEATARRRQGAGVAAQRDLDMSKYLDPGQLRKQNYPLIDGLIQAGMLQSSSDQEQ